MRLLAEERRNQTLPFLITAPVSVTQIVLGKFLALLAILALPVGLIVLMALSLYLGGRLDLGLLAANALGLLLLCGCFAAVGLYLSSLTAQPLVAAVGTFAARSVAHQYRRERSAERAAYALADPAFREFLQGSGGGEGRGLLRRAHGLVPAALRPPPGRRPAARKNTLFALLLVAAAFLAVYLLKDSKAQWDITSNQRSSLSQPMRDVLAKMQGPVRITAYATHDAMLGDVRQQVHDFLAPYQRDLARVRGSARAAQEDAGGQRAQQW
jgi:hypothetical protein